MIARLRLMLADLAAKESSFEALRRQYSEQRKKIISYTLYSETSLDTSLGLLRDLDERLAEANSDLDRLSQIRRKAESELESLQLTRGVEQAKAELAKLQQRRETESVADPQVPSEDHEEQIRRLQSLINEASDRAARNIGGTLER
jgi:DNA repair exonuclease SbcCD ATPase subunit